MKKQKSVRKVWVLVDLDAPKKYIDPGMRYVKYSGNEDFAMFRHTPTNDVLEAMHFGSFKEAAKYLDENKNSIFGPKTTFPREVTISTTVEL